MKFQHIPGALPIPSTHHHNRIPPSLAIARYLHQFTGAETVTLVGPLFDGKTPLEEPVIFVDGGVKYRQSGEGLSVGDGDSTDQTLDEQINPEKDYSDLAYVLASLPQHVHQVLLLGFLGGRRDHEWANFGEVDVFLSQRQHPARLCFGDSVTGYSPGQWQIELHTRFSLMCLQPAEIQMTGEVQYRLQQPLDPLSSHGLSNIGHGRIYLQTNRPVYILID